ncbi:MAG: stage III sporulation protein AG [Oscillospiraceae bacterium]|jgi:stage III sporulation protein AG|nr:stage III sporulation protein AG [Oscillospiraceae bacterium]
MDRLKAIWEKLKKGGSLGFAVIIVVFGALLLLLPTGEKAKIEPTAEPPTADEPAFSLPETEARIAAALSQIDGAGEVTVVLTLKSDGQTIIATDRKLSEKGENETRERSEDAVIVGSGGSVQAPVILGHVYPEFRGALVVAEGANNPDVRLQLLGAVSSLTGLGTDKVTVSAMRRRE